MLDMFRKDDKLLKTGDIKTYLWTVKAMQKEKNTTAA
jgi:hypothetical protein